MEEEMFTREKMEEIVAKRTESYEHRYTEALQRAQNAEETAVKYIVRINELEGKVDEWKARVGRRNDTIKELKSECYDLHKLLSETMGEVVKGMVCEAMSKEDFEALFGGSKKNEPGKAK